MPGRPPVKPSISLVLWVFVEMMRDRRGDGIKRASVREASKRVDNHLRESFLDAQRYFRWETIREHHEKFEAIMRKSNSGEERKLAVGFLDFARQRREQWGWDVSTWALVIDPATLKAQGFDISFPTGLNFPPTT